MDRLILTKEESLEQIKNERREKNRNNYLSEMKDNTNFIVGFGGAMAALIIFHYSVFKIRETEFFKVNVDMLNENIFIDGIRDSLQLIILIMNVISIMFVATYYPRRQLSGKIIEIQDGKTATLSIDIITLIFFVGGLLVIDELKMGYEGDIPNSKQAFVYLVISTMIHLIIAWCNFQLTTKQVGNKTVFDFPVLLQFVYVVFMIIFYLFPYFFINNQISKTDSIIITEDHQFILVEKNKSDLLLREMNPRESYREDEFVLADKYVIKNAKEITLIEQQIDKTIDFEKKHYIKFEDSIEQW